MKTYTTEELTDILHVSKRTLYRYIKAATLKAVKLGREYRVTENALQDFLKTGTETKASKRV